MNNVIPDVSFCQSCGMPLEKPEDFGTNKDKGRSDDYCHFCFKSGRFTEPNITMEEMIKKVAGFMARMRIAPEEQAKEAMRNFIPKLKRWRG
ncbi:MAG: zinc ribbon domain-containing protein [Deltaproteobacteria bacterium]|nr:zinc ribbon domain-containing protein [Deltaproteobacteria bacterium]